jgi:AAA domain (dynein-related subfamily)
LINFKPNEKFTEVVSLLKSGKINTLKRSSDFDEYKEFIKQFPASELTSLSLDQYCIGKKDNSNFCWWLERGLVKPLGRFSPGSSKGHIIYYNKNGDIYKNDKLKDLKDNDALIYTLKIQSVIANADTNSDLSWIDNDDEIYVHAKVEKLVTIGNARKLRLLSSYNPELFIPISSSTHLGHFLKVFGCPDEFIPHSDKSIARMLLLLELYKIACKEIENLSTFAFMRALYSEELNIAPKKDEDSIARMTPKIWKISHGQRVDISDDDNQLLFTNNLVAVGYKNSKRKHQRENFLKINSNDYFYLVRRSEIILLGQLEVGSKEVDEQGKLEFDGISIQLDEKMSGWVCRKIKAEVNLTGDCEPTRVVGHKSELSPFEVNNIEKDCPITSRKCMPSGISTVHAVENNFLEPFTKYVLKPVFNLSLENLSITLSSDNIPYAATHSKGNKMHSPKNQILFGPPGTGKTYNTVNKAIEIANPDFFKDNGQKISKERVEIKAEFDRLMEEGQIVFTTFHQSMCYEDFIEGIKPLKPLIDDSFVKYDIQPGIFKQICDKAKSNFENAKTKNKDKVSFEDAFEKLKEDCESDTNISFQLKTEGNAFTVIGFTSTSIQFRKASGGTNHTLSINTLKDLYYGLRTLNFNQGLGIYYPSILEKLESYSLSETRYTETKAFVLIIDEINRGNVSQIFGELITLIEDDKRLDCDEALEVTLPYSKESFGVPKNLYIIGTMNTADRSVEALDAALRRRFSFEEMPPKFELIRTDGKLKETHGILESEDFDDIDLSFLLERINERIEKLLDKDHQIGHSYFMSVESLNDLKLAFQNKIIPLLQEYFFGDYGKIGLVLGKGFVFIEKDESNKNIFANFPDADASDFTDKIIYKIKTFEIDQKSNDDFIKAINSLLNKKTDGE